MTWVADRTGHHSSQMIYRYRRVARTLAELNVGPLTPLVEAIPELVEQHSKKVPPDGEVHAALGVDGATSRQV